MKPVLSSAESYLLDNKIIINDKITDKNLMDRAGKGIAHFIIENIQNPFEKDFIVIAGPGKNGNDAIICHYYLLQFGVHSTLLLCNEKQKNNWTFSKYSIDNSLISVYDNTYSFSDDHWYIDGIFGIGLNRPIKGHYKDVIANLNSVNNIISIDIPSGIDSNAGNTKGISINASLTLAVGWLKLGYFFNDALDKTGEINIIDLGLNSKYDLDQYIQYLDNYDIINIAPRKLNNIDKYSRGRVLSITGSTMYPGACYLAVNAALRAGAGIVKAVIPESQKDLFEQLLIEPIVVPIDDDENGVFKIDEIDEIIDEMNWPDVIIFGSGLSTALDNVNWMKIILKSVTKPLILDGSGFLPFIEGKLEIDELPLDTILTPHYFEFSRLFNIDINKVKNHPIEAARAASDKLNSRILILKGPTTIIITSDKKEYIINHNNSLLATAGSGDVLTGILGSLISQGLSKDNAALYGTFIHGKTSSIYCDQINSGGMIASDIISLLPEAMEIN